jgi:hypothetical protein
VALYAHGGLNKVIKTREEHIFKLIPRRRYIATQIKGNVCKT